MSKTKQRNGLTFVFLISLLSLLIVLLSNIIKLFSPIPNVQMYSWFGELTIDQALIHLSIENVAITIMLLCILMLLFDLYHKIEEKPSH